MASRDTQSGSTTKASPKGTVTTKKPGTARQLRLAKKAAKAAAASRGELTVSAVSGARYYVNPTTQGIKVVQVKRAAELDTFLFGAPRGSKAKITSVTLEAVPYKDAFLLPLAEQATVTRRGISPTVIKVLADEMGVNQGALADQLGVARSTLGRKLKSDEKLSQPESEKALGVVRLIGMVEKMVADAKGPANFDAAEWVGQWLEQPLLALGGMTPGSYMDTAPGQQLVAQILAQAQAGSYA